MTDKAISNAIFIGLAICLVAAIMMSFNLINLGKGVDFIGSIIFFIFSILAAFRIRN